MNTLQAELRRLYLPPDSSAHQPGCAPPHLVTADGRVRALVLEVAQPADWNAMSTVWQGVQADLALPAPAIAITGDDGYQLWFSLTEMATLAQAQAFLEGLRQRYLSAVAPQRIRLLPTATAHAAMAPALQPQTGLWSAFVAPDLAAIFADAPGLDVCPSPEAQAKVLARLASTAPAAFTKALQHLGGQPEQRPAVAPGPGAPPRHASAHPAPATSAPSDARRFLHDVMHDPAIAMPLRIEAAKALLPYS